MKTRALALGLTALILVVAGPAAAQYQMVSPMLYNGPRISLQSHADRYAASPPAAPSAAPSASPSVRGPAAPATLTYRPDLARRKANLARFVEQVRRVDPAGADALAKTFAQGDFIARLQADLRPTGLRVDDLSDAFASYWICAWQASRGDASTPDRALVAAVKAQAAGALAGKPEIARASDAAKQDLAEALWVQAAMLDGATGGAQGNPEQLRALAQAATQGAAGTGLDLSRVALTPQGFVAKAG